jgi:GT2 family glycosyltransferase
MNVRVVLGVLTYQRVELLGKLLRSAVAQVVPFSKIIIFDNDPAASSRMTVQDILEGKVDYEYFASTSNLGSSGGFNRLFSLAAKHESFSHFVSADDDIEFTPDFLDSLLRGSEEFPHSVILGGRRYASGRPFTWAPVVSKSHPARVSKHLLMADGAATEVDSITFEGCLIPLEVVRQVGLPMEEFFIDGDDWEYGLRIRRAGFRLLRIPAVNVIRNLEPPTRAVEFKLLKYTSTRPLMSPVRTYYEVRNKFRINSLHSPSPGRSHAREALSAAKRIVGTLLFDGQKAATTRYIIKGVWDGLRGVSGKLE